MAACLGRVFYLRMDNMKSNFSLALTLFFCLSSCASTPTSKNTASPSASPDAISIDASQSIQFPMTAKEKKKLQLDFKKATLAETKSLANKEKAAMKVFNVDQAAAKKSWSEVEKKSRRAFFDAHMSGPERREYIQLYLKRKDDFDKKQKEELATAKTSWREKRDYLKNLQKDREAQFLARLSANQRPDASLWPSN